MNASLRFDIIAEAFRLETGWLAPGKDDASGGNYQIRKMQFDNWERRNHRSFDCIIKAIENVTGNSL